MPHSIFPWRFARGASERRTEFSAGRHALRTRCHGDCGSLAELVAQFGPRALLRGRVLLKRVLPPGIYVLVPLPPCTRTSHRQTLRGRDWTARGSPRKFADTRGRERSTVPRLRGVEGTGRAPLARRDRDRWWARPGSGTDCRKGYHALFLVADRRSAQRILPPQS